MTKQKERPGSISHTRLNTNALIQRYKAMIYGGLLLILLLITANSLYLGEHFHSRMLSEQDHRSQQTLLALSQTISVSINHVGKMQTTLTNAYVEPTLLPGAAAVNYLEKQATGSPAGAPWENLPENLRASTGQLLVHSAAPDTDFDIQTLLSMMPEVVATHQQHDAFQWSYYYDDEKLMTQVYPWVSYQDLQAATGTKTIDDAIEVIYQAGGTYPLELVNPAGNPDKQKVWTTPYMDAGGKGMMVSLLAPIYHQQRFVGAVGTDITLSVLDKILTKSSVNLARLALVDAQGLVVGDSGGELQGKSESVSQQTVLKQVQVGEAHLAAAGELQQSATGYWIARPLEGTPWVLVLEISNLQIRNFILDALAPNLVMGGFFAVLLLSVMLYQHRQFSQPALQLAKFVEELPLASDISIPVIPSRWRSWFARAAQTEQDRRAHLATIKQQTKELEQRVAERTAELNQALETLQTAQEQLIQSEKLAALGSLVAGVAHEMNTPIGNALMVASSLKDLNNKLHDSLESGLRRSDLDSYLEKSGKSAESIERNLLRAAELITSFKQVAVDQSSYRRRTFDLAEALHELEVTMMPQLRENKVELEITQTESIVMDSYPGPLAQVLMNLVANSIVHAFPAQKERQINISYHPEDSQHVVICVRDNGAGISPENLPRLFEPFFTTRLGQGGSGLGLHIVYNLVSGLLGGDIQVSSEPGKGTRFTLNLPLTGPENASDTEGESP